MSTLGSLLGPGASGTASVDDADKILKALDRNQTPRMPWHDVQVLVQGLAAQDVAWHFIENWNHHRIHQGDRAQDILFPYSDRHGDLRRMCLMDEYANPVEFRIQSAEDLTPHPPRNMVSVSYGPSSGGQQLSTHHHHHLQAVVPPPPPPPPRPEFGAGIPVIQSSIMMLSHVGHSIDNAFEGAPPSQVAWQQPQPSQAWAVSGQQHSSSIMPIVGGSVEGMPVVHAMQPMFTGGTARPAPSWQQQQGSAIMMTHNIGGGSVQGMPVAQAVQAQPLMFAGGTATQPSWHQHHQPQQNMQGVPNLVLQGNVMGSFQHQQLHPFQAGASVQGGGNSVGYPPHQPPPVESEESKLNRLLARGFPFEAAFDALIQSKYNFELALESLTFTAAPPAPPTPPVLPPTSGSDAARQPTTDEMACVEMLVSMGFSQKQALVALKKNKFRFVRFTLFQGIDWLPLKQISSVENKSLPFSCSH
jgi:hypothetical protein